MRVFDSEEGSIPAEAGSLVKGIRKGGETNVTERVALRGSLQQRGWAGARRKQTPLSSRDPGTGSMLDALSLCCHCREWRSKA